MNPIKYEQALPRLAAYCSRAERCVQDVVRKMIRWELSEAEQKKLIQALQKERFLDEQRFCRAFVHDKSRYNRWGIHKIRFELKKKHLPETLIQEALSEINSEDQREQLRQLLASKRKTIKAKDDFDRNQKLIRFAAGKGFSYDDIEAALL
jgi:regulatory protein